MSLRAQYLRTHPGFPWLAADDRELLAAYLGRTGWLAPGETINACERAGEGNMNLTLRVTTDRRRVVLKQARPWVEKYDHIPAPWDRMLVEQRFYARIAAIPEVAGRMPRVLGSDPAGRVLLLEDLPGARDLGGIYDQDVLDAGELAVLASYLRALHAATAGAPEETFANRAMRRLNHEHLCVVPLADENGLDLDRFEPYLTSAAARLRADLRYRAAVEETGRRYLADGNCLVHGDFFPGSWLRTDVGLRVIDPEFCFYGDPEVDLGFAVAHLVLARCRPGLAGEFLAAYGGPFDRTWIARYAALEVMRRLLGVAQLPIPPTTGWRAALLERSRWAMLDRSLAALWG